MFHVRSPKFYKERRDSAIRREDHVKLFRFREESVEWIAEHFLGNNNDAEETRGGVLSSVMKTKIYLRYVADPGFQIGVAEFMGVSQPTVSNVVKYVTQKIVEKAPLWIHFPQSAEELQVAKEKWQNKYNFPTAIGALDCTHIQIKKIHRHRHGNEYLNRKNLLKRERVIIERCFGQVKHRFPILENIVRLNTDRVPGITVACFVLHNVSKYLNDEDVLEDFEFHLEEPHDNFEDGDDQREPNVVNIRVVGQMKRRELATIIYRQ